MIEAEQGHLPGVSVNVGTGKASDSCFTPRYIVDAAWEAMGGIDTDFAWHPESHVEPRIHAYGGGDTGDGLTLPIEGNLWHQPPYSGPEPWCIRFRDYCNSISSTIGRGSTTALGLLKLDPTTGWWRVMREARIGRVPTYIGLVDHRVCFEGKYAQAKTPNMCVAFHACGILHSHLKRTIPFADWGQP